jgi:hypothetical protein
MAAVNETWFSPAAFVRTPQPAGGISKIITDKSNVKNRKAEFFIVLAQFLPENIDICPE